MLFVEGGRGGEVVGMKIFICMPYCNGLIFDKHNACIPLVDLDGFLREKKCSTGPAHVMPGVEPWAF